MDFGKYIEQLKIPERNEINSYFISNYGNILSNDKGSFQSVIGNRTGMPEPKRAYNFDGVDDGLQVSDPYNFLEDSNLKPATVRVVLKFPALTNTTPVASSTLASSADRRWHIRRTGGGQIEIRFMNSNAAGSRTIALTDSTFTSTTSFYDVTFTYNGVSTSSIKIYINGVEAAHTLTEDNFTGNILASATINVGQINSATFSSVQLSSLEIFDSVLSSNNLEKLWKYTFNGIRKLFWKCDENLGSISFDSSGNENHGTINQTGSTFFYEGADVPFSFQNEIGFTISDGATYYREAALTNLIPAGVYIPRDESNTTKCTAYITGGVQAELVKKGKIRELAKITNVNVGVFDGNDDEIVFTNTTLEIGDGTNRPPFTFVIVLNWDGSQLSIPFAKAGNTANSIAYSSAILATGEVLLQIVQEGSGVGSDRIRATTVNTIPSNTWIALIMKYNGGTDYTSISFEAYNLEDNFSSIDLSSTIDGDTGTFTAIKTNTDSFMIGRNLNSLFKGSIADVQFFASELSTQDTLKVVKGQLQSDVFHVPIISGRGLTAFDITGNDNHGMWQNVTDPDQWGKSDVGINYLMINGCEIFDDDATHTNIIRVPFRNDGTRITPTISGYSKVDELLPIEQIKEFDNNYDCEINFQYYEALNDNLPTDYQVGDAISNNMLVDSSITNKVKKIIISKEDINNNERLKRFTKTI